MSSWAVRPGCHKEAIGRFLSGGGQPPAGVKLLARWHKTDGSGGYSLMESDDPRAAYEYSAMWFDVVEIHSCAVIEDADAGPALAKAFQK